VDHWWRTLYLREFLLGAGLKYMNLVLHISPLSFSHFTCTIHMYNSHFTMYNSLVQHPITGWRLLIGSPKLQIIFHKRASKYRSLLRKMTYKIRDPLSLRHNVLDFDSKTVTSENIQENTTERQGQAKAERG